MPLKLAPYAPQAPIRSGLLKNRHDSSVPSTEDMENLLGELQSIKQRAFERSRKSGEDSKALDAEFRRIKDREKGKRAVKREREFTPLPGTENPGPSSSRHSSIPTLILPPSSSRNSQDPRHSALSEDRKKKKKKRKRELEDSEVEGDPSRPRKHATPPVLPPPPHVHKPIKLPPAVAHPKTMYGQEFGIPTPVPMVPLRPPVPPPPIPGPNTHQEVMENFSTLKQPANQTVLTTYYSSIEPWTRPIKEEDVGFLEYTADEVEPFVMPKLGRHYVDQWEDEDYLLYGGPMPGFSAARFKPPPPNLAAPKPTWDPSTLGELDLLNEDQGHGPLTERLMSALLPMGDAAEWRGVKAAEDQMEGRHGGNGGAAARKEKMQVLDLEQRIRDTMQFHGLLSTAPADYSEKIDDPISAALRQAQRSLRDLVAVNKARKQRLADIARDRLAYQEYVDLRESIDKNISHTFTKLQKKEKEGLKKGSSLKKKVGDLFDFDSSAPDASLPPPCPAATGLGPDDENVLVVPEALRTLVETRRNWVDTIGGVMTQKQTANPGRLWGFPPASIFDEEEKPEGREERDGMQGIKMEAEAPPLLSRTTSTNTTIDLKGKGKARSSDDMDTS